VSEDTRELSPDELAIWMHLTGVVMTLPGTVDAQLKRSAGINFFEFMIMMRLSRTAGRAMQLCELAQVAFGSPSRLSHAISRLEKQGWVERRSSGRGAHSVDAVLTDAGVAKLAEAMPGHLREIRRLVFDVLDPAQLSHLREISARILAVTAPDAASRGC
jgi:DNA-binding MarR family transcriptional regulator